MSVRSVDETFGDLLRRAKDEIANLVRVELESARREMVVKVKRLSIGLAMGAIALVFAVFAIVALTIAFVAGLSTLVAPWIAAAIVTVVYALIAAVAALAARSLVTRAVPPLPTTSLEHMKEDIGWITKRINSRSA